MEVGRRLQPRDRVAWRRWLAQHHAGPGEIWLMLAKKGSGAVSVAYDEAVEEALCFGWVDGLTKTWDATRYVVRFTPRKPGSRWSASNRARVEALLAAGKMMPPGLALVEAAKASGAWDASLNERSTALPPELQALVEKDRRVRAVFESLTPGRQRMFVAWVLDARRPETRRRRIQQIDKIARG